MNERFRTGDLVHIPHTHSVAIFLGHAGHDDYGHFLMYDPPTFSMCKIDEFGLWPLPAECEICGMPIDTSLPIISTVCDDCDDYLAGLYYDG